MSERAARSRRLLMLFAATTIVPAASLTWVGWRLVAEGRLQETRRAEVNVAEAREHAADLAVSALHRVLAEAEEKLTEFNAAPEVPVSLEDGSTLLAFGRDGVVGRSGTALPWYPAIPTPSSKGASDRAETLLRQARIQRQIGNTPQALALFDELGTLEGARTMSGLPAGLAARLGRALIFEATSRRDELGREARALRRDLAEGRWPVTRPEFEGGVENARAWVPADLPQPPDPERVALADVADMLWTEWQARTPRADRGRALHRVGDLSVLALTRSSDERLTLLLLTPRFLESVWLKEARVGASSQNIDIALADPDGPVLGRVNGPSSLQAVRLPSATLPWTVYAIGAPTLPASPPLSSTTWLLLTGIAIMLVLLLAVAYFIHRTMVRELDVAQLQSDFVAAVSHEFRTPLTTMRQLSEMLVRGRFSSETRRQEFYETLLRESDRLQKLVEGVLDFKRFEAGGAAYRFETIEAASFVREVVSEFDKGVAAQGFRVELAAPDGDLPVTADRDALTRAIWNLLDNAAKYSPECRTIWVDVWREVDKVCIAVRDQGLGIPADQQGAIFERFVRGEQSKALGIKGTGIGLAVVKTIVQAHGGEIRLASEPGQGSRFTVLLRAAEAVS